MDNLLPTVAVADVTSDQFREISLPYQQWEVGVFYQSSERGVTVCAREKDETSIVLYIRLKKNTQ